MALPQPPPASLKLTPLPSLSPDLYERAWASVPHPAGLPLLATAHSKAVTVFSLSTLTAHSTLSGGHTRSVRCVAWKPGLASGNLCLVTGSFDSTAGLWRREDPSIGETVNHEQGRMEKEVTARTSTRLRNTSHGASDSDSDAGVGSKVEDWDFTLVLEGHDSEIKSVAFSPSGQYLATCARDKSVWIWEDVGATDEEDEWETVAVLTEHDGDVKAVAWCPDTARTERRGRYSSDCLASASYDDTVRIWREDGDGEWVCVSVLEGHKATVWGVQWEGQPRDGGKYPRLITYSADGDIRVWSLKEDDDADEGAEGGGGSSQRQKTTGRGLGGIPNTMRRSVKEEWICTAVLPKAHTRDIYSVAWSATSGLVASTGSDGRIAVYCEDAISRAHASDTEAAMELDGDENLGSRPGIVNDDGYQGTELGSNAIKEWRLLTTVENAHGPYEVNHVVWSKRFDSRCRQKGEEEMLVTTGDDGTVRLWQVT